MREYEKNGFHLEKDEYYVDQVESLGPALFDVDSGISSDYSISFGTPSDVTVGMDSHDVSILAPDYLVEGEDTNFSITLVFDDVSSLSATVRYRLSPDSEASTSDVSVGSGTISFSVAQVPTRDYSLTLPSFGSFNLIDDAITEGTEILRIEFTIPGRTFENGQSTFILEIPIYDNEPIIANSSGGTLNGTPINDLIQGQSGDDLINGLDGNDVISGGGGNDTLQGGNGDDRINGGSGSDVLTGGDGVDVFEFSDYSSGSFSDQISDLSRDDEILFLAPDEGSGLEAITFVGTRVFSGTAGEIRVEDDGIQTFLLLDSDGDGESDQTLVIDGAFDFESSLNANGSVSLSALAPREFGTSADDVFNGDDSDQNYFAGDGNDIAYTFGGNDRVDGGAGNDGIILGSGNDFANGGADNDTIYGQDGDDQLYGEGGIDRLFGGDGDDILDGGADIDVLVAGNGNDTVIGGDGNDTIYAEGGDDLIFGGAGNDTIFGGAGHDTAEGGAGIDVLVMGDGNDTVAAGLGSDVIYGQAGDDLIFGEAGNDTIFGGSGNNTLIGGAGIDVLVAEDGNDAIDGGADNDVIYSFGGDDVVDGGDGSDTIFGGAGNDTLRGGAGNDVIADMSGNDNLDGGDGNDVVNALAGDDRVTGGNGDNIVLGGTGADVFYQAGTGTDRILDFQIGIDKIELSSSVTDFQTLIASAQDITDVNGDNFVIIANGDNGQFVLSNLSIADLSESDFIFTTAGSAESTAAKADLSAPVSEGSDALAQDFGINLESDFAALMSRSEFADHLASFEADLTDGLFQTDAFDFGTAAPIVASDLFDADWSPLFDQDMFL